MLHSGRAESSSSPAGRPELPYADFVHLRVHSSYSLSEGAIKADKIAQLARDAAMPAVAITDSGNLFGALEFSQACVGRGVQPIVGCQVGISRADNPRLPPDPIVLLADHQTTGGYPKIAVLASADQDGFAQLRSREAVAFRAVGAEQAVAAAVARQEAVRRYIEALAGRSRGTPRP